MTPITLVLPYYLNAGMLREQQRIWLAYPPELRAQFHAIVVDDGSPRDPAQVAIDAAVPLVLASFQLYRIKVDVRWNWLACRNLGVHVAATKWVLLTDMDHVVPESTLRVLMTVPLDGTVVYRFSRVDAPHETPYKPHPNSWLLTRKMFDAIGGYDERFSGYYGTDADFRERVQQTARAVVLRPEPLVRYPRDVIPDASTTTYRRKEPQDRIQVARIREARARERHWRPKRLTFPYTRVI